MFIFRKKSDNSSMGMKIHLKFRNLSKFYYICQISFKYSVIMYARVNILFCIFFQMISKSFVKDVGRRKSRKDVYRRKYRIDLLKITQTRTYFTLSYIFFSHLFLKIRDKVLGRTSVAVNLRRTSVGRNFKSMLARKNNILQIAENFRDC